MNAQKNWCTARYFDPDVTCELRWNHAGNHRAEFAPPTTVQTEMGEKAIAQVVSWS